MPHGKKMVHFQMQPKLDKKFQGLICFQMVKQSFELYTYLQKTYSTYVQLKKKKQKI